MAEIFQADHVPGSIVLDVPFDLSKLSVPTTDYDGDQDIVKIQNNIIPGEWEGQAGSDTEELLVFNGRGRGAPFAHNRTSTNLPRILEKHFPRRLRREGKVLDGIRCQDQEPLAHVSTGGYSRRKGRIHDGDTRNDLLKYRGDGAIYIDILGPRPRHSGMQTDL